MPELAEVELARRTWNHALGQTVTEIHANKKARIFRTLPPHALSALMGEALLSSTRHGKRLYFTFSNAKHLEVHLGMSGKVFITGTDYPHRKHDHLLLQMTQNTLILNDYRMFGKVELHEDEPWHTLPPDPLSQHFTPSHLHQICEARPKKSLKGALLDQALFPGIGNWMADEICWRLRMHPATPISQLNSTALHKETLTVCEGAIQHVADANPSYTSPPEEAGFHAGGYVAQTPPVTWLFQHRWKKGGSCPQCHTTLSRGTIATRTTAWCSQCQPTP